jgi:hypothetical protein
MFTVWWCSCSHMSDTVCVLSITNILENFESHSATSVEALSADSLCQQWQDSVFEPNSKSVRFHESNRLYVNEELYCTRTTITVTLNQIKENVLLLPRQHLRAF